VNTPFSFSGISCGDGFDLPNTFVAKSAGQTPQENKPLDTSQEACDLLYKAGHNYFETGIPANDKKGYDTLRLFIESCANVKYVALCGEPWMAFGEITGNAQGMSDDNNRWLDYREWLKKVLYLNRDTMYYCEDVNSMFSTFEYWIPDKGIDYNGIISIIDFLLSTNRCPYEIDRLLAQRASVRNKQLHIWRDSVQDSLKTPIDTSAITIDSIGFSILRGQQNAVNTPTASDKSGIGWVRAERNPFNEETALIYDLETTELIKLEVFDLLGNMIYQEGGGIAQAGEHRFDLKTKSWSPGTYYARITTYHGGVKTIKLIKE
jgi:hypothetical protein